MGYMLPGSRLQCDRRGWKFGRGSWKDGWPQGRKHKWSLSSFSGILRVLAVFNDTLKDMRMNEHHLFAVREELQGFKRGSAPSFRLSITLVAGRKHERKVGIKERSGWMIQDRQYIHPSHWLLDSYHFS